MNEKPACCIVAAISIISCVSSPSVAAAVADDVVIGFTVLLLADVPLVSTVVGGLVRAFRSTGRFGRRLTVVLTTPSALNNVSCQCCLDALPTCHSNNASYSPSVVADDADGVSGWAVVLAGASVVSNDVVDDAFHCVDIDVLDSDVLTPSTWQLMKRHNSVLVSSYEMHQFTHRVCWQKTQLMSMAALCCCCCCWAPTC